MTKIDTSGLSYDFLNASAISVDWDKARREDGEGVTVHMPEPTASILKQYDAEPEAFDAADWLTDNLRSYLSKDQREEFGQRADDAGQLDDDWLTANWRTVLDAETIAQIEADMAEAKADHDEDELETAIERFKGSDGFYEWQDSNQPMMNLLWPCEPFRVSDEEAAAAIEDRAGATVLVTITQPDDSVADDIQGIALTGGGMDMSWDICAAYICCGCIPPARLLGSLPHFAGQRATPMTDAILECMILAADWLQARSERMREEHTRMVAHLTKGE